MYSLLARTKRELNAYKDIEISDLRIIPYESDYPYVLLQGRANFKGRQLVFTQVYNPEFIFIDDLIDDVIKPKVMMKLKEEDEHKHDPS